MADFLTQKKIRKTKTETGSKKYSVMNLRKEVRELIKQSNRIIADLPDSSKSKYMKAIKSDIATYNLSSDKSGEFLTQTKVKWMKSKELMSTYNALTAFIEADKESTEYAERLADRRERARKAWEKSQDIKISKNAYDQMINMFDKYSDMVEHYGYNEVLNLIKKRNKSHAKGSLVEDLKQGEEYLKEMGEAPEPKKVLKYLSNKSQFEKAKNYLGEDATYDDIVKLIGKQK